MKTAQVSLILSMITLGCLTIVLLFTRQYYLSFLAAFTMFLLPIIHSRFSVGSENRSLEIDGSTAYAILKDGIYLRLKKGVLKDGTLTIDDRQYVVKNFKPLILVFKKLGKNIGYPAFILHPDYNIVYTFEEPNIKEIEQKCIEEAKIRPVMQNPRVIRHYISSNVIQKLVSKLQASKMEIAMALLTGIGLAYFIEFFILPLLGYRIVIGG